MPLEIGLPLGVDDGESLGRPLRNLLVLGCVTHDEPPHSQWPVCRNTHRITCVSLHNKQV